MLELSVLTLFILQEEATTGIGAVDVLPLAPHQNHLAE
jgi:hypothetical protein